MVSVEWGWAQEADLPVLEEAVSSCASLVFALLYRISAKSHTTSLE
jgi:hypothetical protein